MILSEHLTINLDAMGRIMEAYRDLYANTDYTARWAKGVVWHDCGIVAWRRLTRWFGTESLLAMPFVVAHRIGDTGGWRLWYQHPEALLHTMFVYLESEYPEKFPWVVPYVTSTLLPYQNVKKLLTGFGKASPMTEFAYRMLVRYSRVVTSVE
jgi:hypothetical protein